jgi:hypothetical protein
VLWNDETPTELSATLVPRKEIGWVGLVSQGCGGSRQLSDMTSPQVPPINGTYVDASRSTFNDVRGDQIFHFNAFFYGLDSDEIFDQLNNRLPSRVADALRSPLTSTKDLTQRRSRVLAYLRRVSGSPDDILCLVRKIRSLICCDLPSTTSRVSLELELEHLYQILQLTAMAIKAYEYTQLGQSLAQLINPYLLRCIKVLRELCEAIELYQRSHRPTSIWFLWRIVWWYGYEGRKPRDELSICRRSLAMFVKALNL